MAKLPTQPPIADEAQKLRVGKSALRHRLMDGEWEQDGSDMILNRVGEEGRELMGVLDLSANPFKQIAVDTSVLYNVPPTLHHEDEAAEALIGPQGELREVGLWTKMRELQRYTWALRDYFVRVDLPSSTNRLNYRLVSPHLTLAWPHPDEPDTPIHIMEYRQRIVDGEPRWTIDEIDLRDPGMPIYRVLLADSMDPGAEPRDITEAATGAERSGEAYPYRYEDGTPLMPYEMYHAKDTGRLWNTTDQVEVAIGSLNASVYWTFTGHTALGSSFSSYLVTGVDKGSVDTKMTGRGPVNSTTLKPGTIIYGTATGDSQPTVNAIGPGADIDKMMEFALAYERRIAVIAGLNPADLQRAGGDPRSGYAITIGNASKRELQADQVELYRRHDLSLISKSAALCNVARGSNVYPESGYVIEYAPIPKSAEEKRAEREELAFAMDRGFMSPAEVLMRLRPGITEEEAQRIIDANTGKTAPVASQSEPPNGVEGEPEGNPAN